MDITLWLNLRITGWGVREISLFAVLSSEVSDPSDVAKVWKRAFFFNLRICSSVSMLATALSSDNANYMLLLQTYLLARCSHTTVSLPLSGGTTQLLRTKVVMNGEKKKTYGVDSNFGIIFKIHDMILLPITLNGLALRLIFICYSWGASIFTTDV